MTQPKTTRPIGPRGSRPSRVLVAPAEPAAFFAPYASSPFDRMTAAIERLPGPFWATYVLAFVGFLLLLTIIARRDATPLTPGIVYADSLPFYGFWLIHYLNRRAATAMQAFRPAFTGDEAEFQGFHWRLTTLPAWPALAVSLVAFLMVFVPSLTWNRTSLAQTLGVLSFYVTGIFAGLYAYQTVRRLRLVTALNARWARIDLHNVTPLYAFSTLSAQTAIGMLLLLSGAVLFSPEGLIGGYLLGAIVFAVLAVMTFLLPLTGLHGRLAEVKDAELSAIGQRWQACTAELFRRVDGGDWDGADRLNATLTALERSRTAIERTPTWPWRPETLRGVVATLVLPIVIGLFQRGLARWLP